MKNLDYLKKLLSQVSALVPLLTAYVEEQEAAKASAELKKNTKVQHSPVLYVSARQLAVHKDPDFDKSPERGSCIPARKTAAGLFDTPLYVETQPIMFTHAQLRAAFEAHMCHLGHTTAKLGLASNSEYAQTLVRTYWDVVEGVLQELELYGYAALADKSELTKLEVLELAKKAGMIIDRCMDGLGIEPYVVATERVSIKCSPESLAEFAKLVKG